jgi:23S rRNA (adenine2503-C2)-methyltransferase
MTLPLDQVSGPRAGADGPPLPALLDLPRTELAALLADYRQPAYRARQLFTSLHQRMVEDWSQLTDLPAGLRSALAGRVRLTTSELVLEARSADGTRKRLLRLWDRQEIETVAIPAVSPTGQRRLSVCVSTQAGCAMACSFCATGMMGLARQLTAGEIVDQVYTFGRGADQARPTHVVFMGMGEPLANYEPTLHAIRLLCDPAGLHLSQRRLTVSTSGLVPEIARLAREQLDLTLAISLHAPNDRLRSELMPINRRYPLRMLVAAATGYARTTGRRVSYEYVLLDGVNDQPAQADELAALLPRHLAHVNLIPYNATGAGFRPAPPARARAFLARLRQAGLSATIRASRGRDIVAACGQLRALNRRRSPGADGCFESSAERGPLGEAAEAEAGASGDLQHLKQPLSSRRGDDSPIPSPGA